MSFTVIHMAKGSFGTVCGRGFNNHGCDHIHAADSWEGVTCSACLKGRERIKAASVKSSSSKAEREAAQAAKEKAIACKPLTKAEQKALAALPEKFDSRDLDCDLFYKLIRSGRIIENADRTLSRAANMLP